MFAQVPTAADTLEQGPQLCQVRWAHRRARRLVVLRRLVPHPEVQLAQVRQPQGLPLMPRLSFKHWVQVWEPLVRL